MSTLNENIMLTEHKTNGYHYFKDKQGRKQGEAKWWYKNGKLGAHCFYVDDNRQGESKWWCEKNDQLWCHNFFVNDKEVIDFLEHPELYPNTYEARTSFALKYGLCEKRAGEITDLSKECFEYLKPLDG